MVQQANLAHYIAGILYGCVHVLDDPFPIHLSAGNVLEDVSSPQESTATLDCWKNVLSPDPVFSQLGLFGHLGNEPAKGTSFLLCFSFFLWFCLSNNKK